jgi:thiamine-monophosphate kinase
VLLVGGDTCRAERVTIAVLMVGAAKRGRIVSRGGARPGDAVFVTGPLGGSLASGRHLKFKPRLDASRFLTGRYRVRAMMDLSDGLAKDLRDLGKASGVGIELDEKSIPLNPDVRRRGVMAAFLDGEDFELVFALPPNEAARLERDAAARRNKLLFYRMGRVVLKKQGFTFITADGKRKPFPPFADHHFGS